ncbi:MAG: DMT family transporter [Gemmatimonadota bacterium]|nr:MAG: DMT family transporter [Gemmatimonadota bacterium]
MIDLFQEFLTLFRGECAALAAALFWALATVIYGRFGRHVPSGELNLLKNVLASVMVLLTLASQGTSWLRIDPFALGALLLSGALGLGMGDTAYFESLKCIGPRRALLLGILAPPLAGLIALIFLGERLRVPAWAGIGVTVLGVAWVVSERTANGRGTSERLLRGILFGLMAAGAQATGVVLSRAALTQTAISPLTSALLRLVGGLLFLLLWILLKRRPLGQWRALEESKRIWAAVLLATFIGTYLSIWFQQTALKHTSSGIAQTLFSTSPLFVLPIVFLMGEKISPRAIFGACVALAGVGLLLGFA